MKTKAVIYARVSTIHQTTQNQLLELRAVAERMGWEIVTELTDNGISGAKGRESRPALDQLHQMLQRREIDVVMTWSIDRLGRSIQNLVALMSDIQSAKVDLYVHQQAINTQTARGRMVFGIFASLAEFEREMIRDRIHAGLARAKSEGKKLGRPSNVNPSVVTAVKLLKQNGHSNHHIARTLHIGVGTTSRLLAA